LKLNKKEQQIKLLKLLIVQT